MEKEKEQHISDKVFEKIEEEDVHMKPCCFFVARSWLWLGVAGLLFLVAALLTSFSLYYLVSLEPFDLLSQKTFMLLAGLPYFLIAVTVVIIFLAAMAYRKSRNCCRHENWLLLTVLILGALLVGISAYNAHFQNKMRLGLEKRTMFNNFVMTPQEFWFQPKRGTMSGLVAKTDREGVVWVKTWDGSEWKITTMHVKSIDLPGDEIEEKRMIKMIGERRGEHQFQAQSVWGW